jgi:hypothetical protein
VCCGVTEVLVPASRTAIAIAVADAETDQSCFELATFKVETFRAYESRADRVPIVALFFKKNVSVRMCVIRSCSSLTVRTLKNFSAYLDLLSIRSRPS